MDLKRKLKSFVSRQGTHFIPALTEGTASKDLSTQHITVKKDDIRENNCDPEAEEEILNSIETVYYNDDTFDSGEFVLKKLPEVLDLLQIQNDFFNLKRQHHIVSKKVLDLILQNQSAYTLELQRVMELQKNLETASSICAAGRRSLFHAKDNFTSASLGILASYRKREQLKCLLRSLHMIKTLQETDVRLGELLEEEDYPGAIQLCLECQKAASTFKHYKCICDLSSKLKDTLVMTEEQLDVALSKVCCQFDKTYYEKLQAAYKLLGKTQTAMDQLLMHFTSAIHNKAFVVVLGYVELCAGQTETNFQKRQYTDLCKHITAESFTPCLINLCKALWEIMCSYWCIVEWHEENVNASKNEEINNSHLEAEFSHNYIKQKLECGLLRIWQDVQQKVKAYISSCDLSSFKYDEFIKILDIVRRLMDIGEEFCESKSEDLQESLRKQSLNYFRNYHRSYLEELRMFLENESWEFCPVRTTFSILDLQEFRFLRNSSSARLFPNSPVSSQNKMEKTFNNISRQGNSYFKKSNKINPFDVQSDDDECEDVMALDGTDENTSRHSFSSDSDDSDIPEELKKEYVEENVDDYQRISKTSKKHNFTAKKKQSPILTNTTLNVLRLFGKYMQMMHVLKPIAFDVLNCMFQLFDYYMYAVFCFFAKEMCNLNENILSNKLKATLKRIREHLILDESEFESDDYRKKDKVPPATLSPVVNLKSNEHLYGLAQRVAAAESLVFLAEQFEFLKQSISTIIPASKQSFLHQFCSQSLSTAIELRRPVYVIVSSRAVDYDKILNIMGTVKWDVHDIMSQHSAYVDLMLRELQIFSMKLSEISKIIQIPKEAYDLLWEQCIKLANRTFVEGFSQAKKCTNEGRALMQLDYQQFLSKVEKLTDLRPVPEREIVEGYVKAYYLSESAIEEWIRSHREYTSKQLIGVVNCVTQINKKGRQKLINIIEEERVKR